MSDRRLAAVGAAQLIALILLAAAPAVVWPEALGRAARFATGDGQVVTATIADGRRARVGTPVTDGGATVGSVARNLPTAGRVEVRLEPGSGLDGPIDLVRVLSPSGISWALSELVTEDVVEEFVAAASSARLEDSLAGSFAIVSRTIEERFPSVYAEHKERIEGDLGELWRTQLADRAEGLASRYVVPQVAEEVPFTEIGADVVSGTLSSSPGDSARALLGDEEAKAAVQREVMDQLSKNPKLRSGLRDGARKVWTDPRFRDEVGEAIRAVVDDDELRSTAGTVLSDTLQEALPDIQADLFAEMERLSADPTLDLEPAVRKLLLDETGLAIRPALVKVLRRELLEKDLYSLRVRKGP